jgi:MOSC domain-containing protein YiiM
MSNIMAVYVFTTPDYAW